MELQSKTIPHKPVYEPATEDIEPSGLRYEDIKPLAIEGSIRDMVFTPSNGQEWTVTTATKLVRIPLNTSGFLIPKESYLKFSFAGTYLTAAPAATVHPFNNTAHALIRNMRIIGPGNERLEDIQDYNVLYEIFRTMQVSSDYQASSETIKAGYGVQHANATTYTYTIHPLSGLFLSDKYIPVGFLREPLVLEFDLEVCARCVKTAAAAVAGTSSYTLSNVEFHAMILDMGPHFEDDFKRKLIENNGVEWSSIGYSATTASLTGGTQNNVNCTLPFHSLKSILFMTRITTDDVSTSDYLSFRVSNSITGYRWRIGGKQFPDSGLVSVSATNCATAYTELQRCFGIPSSIGEGGLSTMSADATRYFRATATDESQFVIGLDLETYNEDSSILRSGMDTTKGQTMQLYLQSGAAINAATLCNFFGIYDVVFYLSPTGEIKAIY